MLKKLETEELPTDFPAKPEIARDVITTTKSYVEFDEEVRDQRGKELEKPVCLFIDISIRREWV